MKNSQDGLYLHLVVEIISTQIIEKYYGRR